MSCDYWKANKDIYDTVAILVAANHPDLVGVLDEIAVVFREKAGKSGGAVVLGTSKRVSPMTNALAGESFKFVLDIAADQWEQGLTVKQREALLDHLLCACRVDFDPKTGDPKCYIAKPDVSAFRENVERYGMWFPKDSETEAAAKDAKDEQVAEKEMFGMDDDA